MARGTKLKPTLTQLRAIDGLKAAILGKNDKSLVQILKDAGYADSTAEQWSNAMAGLAPHLKETVKWMEAHRHKVQERMADTIGRAEYSDLVRAFDTMTYNIQLLGGKPTANIQLSAEDRTRLDNLIED